MTFLGSPHFKTQEETQPLGDLLAPTWQASRCEHQYGVKETGPLPGAKRIGWLKTSDSKGCGRPDVGFKKKKRAKSAEPGRWGRTWTGYMIARLLYWTLWGMSNAKEWNYCTAVGETLVTFIFRYILQNLKLQMQPNCTNKLIKFLFCHKYSKHKQTSVSVTYPSTVGNKEAQQTWRVNNTKWFMYCIYTNNEKEIKNNQKRLHKNLCIRNTADISK